MARKEAPAEALQTLKNQLRGKTPGRLYIFHGEEQFLLNHYLASLRKLLVEPLTESFNFHALSEETFSIRAFQDAVEAMPMMAEATMVVVDDLDLFRLPEEERSQVGQILGDIPPWCTVVFLFETVPWHPDKRIKKLWDPIAANSLIVEFARQNQRDLVAWIQRHFAAHSKRINPELCLYLIEITGGTMTALNSEIIKIAAYSGADDICKADIDAVTEPVMDAVVFQMTDLISDGNYGAALEKLHTLLSKQEEPLAILGAIGVHLRRIGAARTLLDHGRTYADLQQMYSMKDFAAKKAMDAARRLRPEFCRRSASLILETDRQIKTSYDDTTRLLELLILRLAQEARNG